MITGYYILAIALLLLVFMLYKEWTRINRARLYLRLLASLATVICIGWLAWPNAEEQHVEAGKKIILVTRGFVQDSLDRFLKAIENRATIFTEDAGTNNNIYHWPIVADWSSFTTTHLSDEWHVFGNGLSDEALSALGGHPLVYHPQAPQPAITTVYWKQQLVSGEMLRVQGSYENTSNKTIKLLLAAFGAGKDSVLIDAGTKQTFSLQTTPVHNGQAVYSLIALSGKDTLQSEPVPVAMHAVVPIQVLIVAATPDFDNTYLKNHLSRQAYQCTMYTTISTNKKERQFLNTVARPAATVLNLTYFNKFDVIITDQETLEQLSPAGSMAIRSAVAENGTGLIVKMEEAKKGNAFYTHFFSLTQPKESKKTTHLLGSAIADSTRFAITIADPLIITPQAGQQMILQDQQLNTYAAAIAYGSGKLLATVIPNSYSLALAGNKTAYQQLWSLLLNKAAKQVNPSQTWHMEPLIAHVNEPVRIQSASENVNKSTTVINDSTTLYLKQDDQLSFLSYGLYWPAVTGWQQLPGVIGKDSNWYVYKVADWQSLAMNARTKANNKYAADYPVTAKQLAAAANPFFINRRLLIYFIFLLGCIFLWVEQKLG